jgi:hypothetical protein
MGVGKQSDVAFTVNNRENFLKALDDAKDAHGAPRFTSRFAWGHVDSMRELGYDVLDPSMHIERYPDKWYAHWDPTSPLTVPTFKEGFFDATTPGRRVVAGLAHEVVGRASTGAVKEHLKAKGLTPKK